MLFRSPQRLAAEGYKNEGTEYTREGTLAHEVAEIVARARTEGRGLASFPWREEVTREMVEHAGGYADYIQEHVTSPDAVVLLEQRVDFSPWVPGGFGTCDCLILQGRTMIVIDYKYGVGVPVSAQDNPQMMLYALGALNDWHRLRRGHRRDAHLSAPDQ